METVFLSCYEINNMWIPKHYEVTDKALITEFIRSVGLATIISQNGKYPFATHIPIELEEDAHGKQVLRGHLATVNPQSTLLRKHPQTMIIFQSPTQHYISSSWYDHPNAPTYNYMSVHICGSARILNEDETYQSVKQLTERYETNSKNPVSLDTLPDSVKRMMKAVTGFEIEIEKVEAQFKLSQNRNEKNMRNIIAELKRVDTSLSHLMAEELERRLLS